MTDNQSPPARPRPWSPRLARFSLVAALMSLFVSALPGVASAAPRQLLPLVDCYAQNSDGTYAVVLGYDSPWRNTRRISAGWNNHATPSTYSSQLPTTFESGQHHGVAELTVSAADFEGRSGVSWYLDGTSLTFSASSRSTTACSSAQLPAFANGAALVVVLLVAGAVGVLLVRRARRAAPLTQPTT